MLSVEKCTQLKPSLKKLTNKEVDSSSVNGIVRKKAKVLQNKYNLLDDEVEKIINILTCISENIINSYIEQKKNQCKIDK